jgi:hypothetical protein
MPAIIEPPGGREEERPLPVRLAWFVVIAAGSAGAVALIAFALRALLR